MQTATVRLVRPSIPESRISGAQPHETYRPLVVGCVRLVRSARERGDWLVRVVRNRPVWPLTWQLPRPLAGCGGRCCDAVHRSFSVAGRPARPITHRLTLGLLCGPDLRSAGENLPPVRLQTCDADIYGWSLLYQPPRLGGQASGLAAVDANLDTAELPAFYESPLELCDRLDFLDRRGIPARPLALVTRPEDFVGAAQHQPVRSLYHRNRFIPEGRFRPPADLSQLPGG